METDLQKQLHQWELDIIQTGYCEQLPFMAEHFTPIGGDMGNENADFIVSEIPAYMPSGSGEHIYLWVEKSGKSTQDVTKLMERTFNVKEINVGCAGKKDVHAITRQWISVQTPSDGSAEIQELNQLPWLKVLQSTRHANKIRMGHLRGNHFSVHLYGVKADDKTIQNALDVLSKRGFINYFGKQRFGFDGDNVRQGIRMINGGKARHQMQKLYVSALQSAIFNLAAARRYLKCGFQILNGDVVQKINAGCFICDDPKTDNVRADNGEVAATLALPGKKVMKGCGEGEVLENTAMNDMLSHWAAVENTPEITDFQRLAKQADGTRRCLSCIPHDLSFKRLSEDEILLDFSLPSGSFATIFLRHLCGPSFTR